MEERVKQTEGETKDALKGEQQGEDVATGAEVEKHRTDFERVKAAIIKAKSVLPQEADARVPGERTKDKESTDVDKPVDKGKDESVKSSKAEKAVKFEDAKTTKQDSKQDSKPPKIPARNLTDEERAALEDAPDIVKKAFARREKELGNSANALSSKLGAIEKELAERKKAYDPVWKEAEKEARTVSALLKAAGRDEDVEPGAYIKELILADKRARKDPAEYVRAFAKANSVDLERLVAGHEAIDYRAHSAAQEVASLRAELDAMKREQQQRVSQQKEQQQREQQVFAQEFQAGVLEIAKDYVSDLDADELLLFDNLSAQMYQRAEAEAIEQGRQVDYATVLREVFTKARSMIPSVTERSRAREADQASQRLQRAQGLAVSPASTRGGVKSGPTSLQERIRQNARAMGILGGR